MSTTEITRGSTVVILATFQDNLGAVINPASATLYVEYKRNAVATLAIIAMTQSVNTWSGSWDSGVADGGRADWHVRSAGSNKAALEGTLLLKTNTANPAT